MARYNPFSPRSLGPPAPGYSPLNPRALGPPAPRAVAPRLRPPTKKKPGAGGGYTPFKPTLLTPVGNAPSWSSPLASDADLQGRAQGYVSAQVDPVIKQITDSINRRGAEGAQEIGQLTGQYATAMQGYADQLPGIYAPAKQEMAATTQALANRITGVGATTGQDLAATLAQAGQANTSGVDPAAIGAGAGTAAYGTGIAELDALIAREASARANAAVQPAIAQGLGAQELGSFQRNLTSQLADQTGQVAAQVPGLTQSILRDLEGERASERQNREAQTQNWQGYLQQLAATNAGTRNEAAQFNVQQRASDAQQRRSNNLTWAQYLQGLADKKGASTGQVYDVVPGGGYGRGGIRPADADPKKKGIQPVYTTAEKNRRTAVNIAQGKDQSPIPSSLGKSSKYAVAKDGTVLGPNPNYVKPSPKADAKLEPNPAKSQAAKSKVMLDGYGRVYHDPKTGATMPFKPTVTKGSAGDPEKGKQSAVVKANSLALSVAKEGAKHQVDPATGLPTKDPAASYYDTIHRIETAIEPILSEYMEPAEIIRFAQRYANSYYGPGKGGRPRAGSPKTATTAPAPPKKTTYTVDKKTGRVTVRYPDGRVVVTSSKGLGVVAGGG